MDIKTLGTAALNAAFGIGLGAYNDSRQLAQAAELQALQIKGQKELTDYNMKKQLQMWHDTNIGPQVNLIKAAGMNPALLYGMKGGGGVTTGNASTSLQGNTAPSGGREIQDMISMGLNMQLLKAQARALETQADKNAAEAAKTAGTDTEESQTRIQSLQQGIDNQRQLHEIQKLEIRLRNIENYEKQATQKDRMDYIFYQTRMAMKNLDIVDNEAFISDQTMNDKITIIRKEAIAAGLRNALTEAQTDKTKSDITINQEQIKKWASEIAQNWQNLDIKKFEAEIKANYPSIGDTIGKMLNTVIERVGEATRGKTKRVETVDGNN